jgi:predicted GNAT family N-acyltransferase
VTTIRLAGSPEEVAAAYAVRAHVFVTEQGVPPELELDDLDGSADHFVAYDGELPVGAGRLVVEDPGFEGTDPALGAVGHLGRLAVSLSARGTGLGVALVKAIEARAADRGLRVVALSAQTHALGFYQRLGYTAYGPEFDDAGLPHRWMARVLG